MRSGSWRPWRSSCRLIAALTDADVFIDCFVDEKAAVVVAQAGPRISGSVYARDVVGKLALVGWEPAVFHARAISMPSAT